MHHLRLFVGPKLIVMMWPGFPYMVMKSIDEDEASERAWLQGCGRSAVAMTITHVVLFAVAQKFSMCTVEKQQVLICFLQAPFGFEAGCAVAAQNSSS